MKPSAELRKAAAWGAVLCALLGLALWVTPGINSWLEGFSFDALSSARNSVPPHEVVIVAMDEASHNHLGQPPGQLWDRSLHAKLLDSLIGRGARAVVFDAIFADKGDPK